MIQPLYHALETTITNNSILKIQDSIVYNGNMITQLEDLHGCLQDTISDSYKINPLIQDLEVLEHYFIKSKKLHFYVIDKEDDTLYGFTITNFGTVTFTIEKQTSWKHFKYEENVTPRRTMKEVFKEYKSIPLSN